MIERIIDKRTHDLGGGFEVGRVLPFHARRTVRREWSETETRPIEPLLREIAATFAAAILLLAEQRVRRKEAAKRHEEAMRLRQAEQERCQLDAARWRKFCELAASLREVQAARAA